MLRKFGKKVSRIWSRIRVRVLAWRIKTRKVMIKRFKKKSPIVIRDQKIVQAAPDHIRVATFNVAMFSLAPAVSKSDGNWVDGVREHENTGLKSILKSSPLHSSSNGHEYSAKKVSINLLEDEISMSQNRVLRSPICFPLIGWKEDGSRSIFDVLKDVDADVLALQDVKAEEENEMKPLSDLAFALGMNYVFAESWAPEYGNAILSKWPIKRSKVQKIYDDQDFRNVLKATIDVPRTGELNFYCTQLDHLDENWRMKQIDAIVKSSDQPHILAGGINSLSGSDYSFDRWSNIVKYYEELGKPTPRTDVTRFLHENKYIDSKHFAGDCEPAVIITKGQSVQGTCKYGTRVDYIMASKELTYQFIPGTYSVVSSKGTSDHHIVKVDLVKLKAVIHHEEKRTKNFTQDIVNATRDSVLCKYL
ncbi:endonuclease/exonuclease/phosphatase, PGAP2-interacting protein [Artemisia annua]|uniref:Endonuclease/exonuclease/phosphatase, PGAP2-interacting protein n=1 Tax=Artemisia annua TaxID=35608 RepID=A0A2U1Q141_ARTAN|nr:endonuclease/exonuclease/phosphatase, PGAP2-interacting protein [Artemisia annua]